MKWMDDGDIVSLRKLYSVMDRVCTRIWVIVARMSILPEQFLIFSIRR